MFNLITPDNTDDTAHNKNKRFWGYVKSLRQDSSGFASLKRDGITHSDSQTKANFVNDRFTSVFTPEPEASLPDLGDSHNPALPTITVTEPGVAKLLCRINVHEATGPDKIPAHLLKEISIQLSSAYTLLFQTSVTQGEIPVDWRHGFVTPLFKKGDRSKAENYRPISLTSITSKLLEHIIESHDGSSRETKHSE